MQLRVVTNRVETSTMAARVSKINDRTTHIAIVGGGLAGGLIALALRWRRPELTVTLIEAGDTLGGNHRWSWFDSDLDEAGRALMAPFATNMWYGYDVRFPAYDRTLKSTYRSLASNEFDALLRRELGRDTIHTSCAVSSLDRTGVELQDGTRIDAQTVIDCRGPEGSAHLTGGWQVFMGRHLRTDRPHGIERPCIMDANVDQHGSCRFVYTLPLAPNEVFIEDTYYDDTPSVDRDAFGARIDAYCREHGYAGETIGTETGILPVITGGDFAAFQRDAAIPGVATAGARGGFVHPLTSYTLPFAVQTAIAIADDPDPLDDLAAKLQRRAQDHWRNTAFYRLLGSMMFGAAEPEERYRVFQHTYRLDDKLIERFYAGQLTMSDKARLLIGRPPVPITGAMTALATKRAPLLAQQEKIG
ncbi:MAG: lycopene beta-cyclase CrtY [Pontixanthobacter sp.]